MQTDKSLEEVWNWKEKIYQETKGMSMEERVRRIKENASRISQRYGLNLKIVNRRNDR
jgi:hypothetical protein